DHKKLDDKVVKVARDHHIEVVEPTMKAGAPKDDVHGSVTTGETAEQQKCMEDMKRLQTLNGGEFDREFLSQQITMHEKVINKLEASKINFKNDGKVKDLIDDAIDTMKDHH